MGWSIGFGVGPVRYSKRLGGGGRRRGGGGQQFDPTDFAPFTPAGTALVAGAIVASLGLVWLTVATGAGWLLFLVPVAFFGLGCWGVHVNDENHEQVIPFVMQKAEQGLPLTRREMHHLVYEQKRRGGRF